MELNQKTVLVAGASGVFGRHVTGTLRAAGYRVLGLGRGPANEVRADLLDRDGLLRAVDGVHADVVVHAATALRRPPTSHRRMYPTDDLRTAGTANLLEATAIIGARRFIGENIVLGYGYRDFGDRVLTEADPFGGAEPDRGFARHVEAMREKERLPLAVPGLEAVSLRYGLFYGAGATEPVVALLRKRAVPAFDDHGHVLPWVNLADAAAAVALAIEHGRPGAAYNIADDSPLGFGAMIRVTAEAFGAPRPLAVPVWLIRVAPVLHRLATMSLRVSTDKAREELGWKPVYRTVAEGLTALREGDRTG
jgi:nucleoside-diphosphate-sugar epimerase